MVRLPASSSSHFLLPALQVAFSSGRGGAGEGVRAWMVRGRRAMEGRAVVLAHDILSERAHGGDLMSLVGFGT